MENFHFYSPTYFAFGKDQECQPAVFTYVMNHNVMRFAQTAMAGRDALKDL